MNQQKRSVSFDYFPLSRVIERHDGYVLRTDVEPDVELRPIGKGKDADTFALTDLRVEDVPEFRPLILRVPLAVAVAKGINALLGAGFFLVSPRPSKRCGEPSGFECIQKRPSLEQAAAPLRSERERVRSRLERLTVPMHDQLHAQFL